MKKSAKIILLTLTGIVATFAVALVLLVTLINPNDFKSEISQVVKEKIHRDLTIKGDIAWSFFPWAGFKVSDISLSNAPGFEQHPFLKAGEVDASIRLLPLLLGEIKMGAVRLADVALNLIRDKDGLSNWEDLQTHLKKESEAKGSDNNHLVDFTISTVHLINVNISWKDKKNNQGFSVQGLELRSRNINLNEPFTINVSAYIKSNTTNFKANVEGSVLAEPNFNKQQYTLKNLHLAITPRHAPFDRYPLTLNMKANTFADLQAKTLEADSIQVYTQHLQFRGKLFVNNILNQPFFNGSIEILPFNPRDLLQEFGQEQAAQTAPESIAGHTKFSGTSNSLSLNPLSLVVDGSKVNGTLEIDNLAEKSAKIELDIDALDLQRYTMDPSNGSAKTQSKPSLLESWLKQAQISGRLSIGELKLKKARLQHLNTQIIGSPGVARFTSARASLYQGKAQADLTIDLRGTHPAYAVNGALIDVNANKLIADLTGSAKLSGTGTVNARLNMRGSGADPLIQSLNGTGSMQLYKGYLEGIDAAFELRRADAIIKKQPAPGGRSKPPRTYYDKITASFRIDHGILRTSDAKLFADNLKATASGKIDLNKKTLNVGVQATGTHLVTQNGKQVHTPNKWSLPIRVTGKLSSPIVSPDFASIGIKIIQDKVNKEIDKRLQDVGDILGNTLDKLF